MREIEAQRQAARATERRRALEDPHPVHARMPADHLRDVGDPREPFPAVLGAVQAEDQQQLARGELACRPPCVIVALDREAGVGFPVQLHRDAAGAVHAQVILRRGAQEGLLDARFERILGRIAKAAEHLLRAQHVARADENVQVAVFAQGDIAVEEQRERRSLVGKGRDAGRGERVDNARELIGHPAILACRGFVASPHLHLRRSRNAAGGAEVAMKERHHRVRPGQREQRLPVDARGDELADARGRLRRERATRAAHQDLDLGALEARLRRWERHGQRL